MDIVERLLELARWWGDEESEQHAQTAREAAAEITRLRDALRKDAMTEAMIKAGARAMRNRLCGLTVMGARQLAEVAYPAMCKARATLDPA